MARRVLAINPWPGLIVAGLVTFFSLGTLAAVAIRADSFGALDQFDVAAVRFTIVQAFWSAVLSVALAIPVARALARRSFWGRRALVTLLGAPFILPVIVAILGLTAVFGRNGIVAYGLNLAGLEPISIYGLHGVLLAHVFFNLPLATRLLIHGWGSVPAEQFRLAASLDFSGRDVFWHIEWPMLRNLVPGLLVVIFLICTTSFAVALTFGGGPKATTVELAIYQAFKFDFDIGKAALLAGVQFTICGVAALASLWLAVPQAVMGGQDRVFQRFDTGRVTSKIVDGVWIIFATLFLAVPLLAIVMQGAPYILSLPTSVWSSALRSLVTALGSAGLTIVFAVSLSLAALRWRWLEGLGMLSVAASPLVMGTGLFIMVFPFVEPARVALLITALVNAVMSLPFVLRAIGPAVRACEDRFGPLSDSLGMTGWARVRLVILPRIRAPLGFSAGLAAALSMGDLGVVTLFARPDGATLPLQIYRLMGAYRMEQAMGAALLLLFLSLALFYLFDRGGRGHAKS
ncbi:MULTISPECIES: thiamine/thiamine pyrophosphate ABC transporter permease ThiP [Pacificibacter]|uniref:thiamine/thiamine pyrophosphate ABC transporter permease ThiP n=1 Tax=Pacificibacter TaxID=1042323 RepID=UPI001C0A55D2|nr:MULTISPECIES: thiamine/thiamine pyrophosphate ABC transporter permease ThiP [Pacificibacter]MBU2936056.1 thiamine/thiamine pyrophosphate ABC transporter permease ThiP [Pacificibacter marinus]MDO6615095.1 thiamine/thiamine pyrophosphate ABC transporter permease ThiP [Pacificibacter sp. 1_MG-2023]